MPRKLTVQRRRTALAAIRPHSRCREDMGQRGRRIGIGASQSPCDRQYYAASEGASTLAKRNGMATNASGPQ